MGLVLTQVIGGRRNPPVTPGCVFASTLRRIDERAQRRRLLLRQCSLNGRRGVGGLRLVSLAIGGFAAPSSAPYHSVSHRIVTPPHRRAAIRKSGGVVVCVIFFPRPQPAVHLAAGTTCNSASTTRAAFSAAHRGVFEPDDNDHDICPTARARTHRRGAELRS